MPPGTTTPFGALEQQGRSPEEAQQLEISIDSGVKERIASARSFAPSVRQQTQSEIINMALLYEQLGNPFSVRRIPFSVMRDMETDPMIAFALHYSKVPLIRADWYIAGPDAQLNAAVDAALRPINSELQIKMCGKLSYGYQPMVKRFRLGSLEGTYRDPQSADPDADLPIWPSDSVDALLWDAPLSLAPEHVVPKWDETGSFDGFTYSIIPVPNSVQIGTAYIYGEQAIPGYNIPLEHAMWPVNEQSESFGSIYGSPRSKRAYRYYWSYWFRWALADRSYENKADPPKVVYYPTDVDEGIDPEDPNYPLSPTTQGAQQRALGLGEQARSGATLALPGDFVRDDDGKTTNIRKWAISYLDGGENFDLLDKTFAYLDSMKMRAMLIPEQAFIEGRGSSSSRNVATQLGEVYQESQQLTADENDEYVTKVKIPQFIAANFPKKIGTPCRKVTRGFGVQDSDLIKQVLTLIGQVQGNEPLPVDTRELLRQHGFPLLSEVQQKKQLEEIKSEMATSQPPEVPPERVGTQGYNAGVGKTPQGESFYYVPRQRIVLSESDTFLTSLPDIPPYQEPTTRSGMLRLRRTFKRRYKQQLSEFASHVEEGTTLSLADSTSASPDEMKRQGLGAGAAVTIAAGIVGAWIASDDTDIADLFGSALSTIVLGAGRSALKTARLDASDFKVGDVQQWVDERVSETLQQVDQTVRSELRAFLTDELQRTTDPVKLAVAVREHFDDAPSTHSDRVARSEARDAYNFGMLKAGQDAGVKQVQAHDASDGSDPKTDTLCLDRNGQVFNIEDAFAEREHPNGTLYFTYLSTDGLSVERVEEIPEHLSRPGMRAAYDDKSETLYVALDATTEQERSYALAVGGRLALR